MNEKNLKSILNLQKRFSKLYSVTGLIGISNNYVQITEQSFVGIFEQYPESPFGFNSYFDETSGRNIFELTIEISGVTILSIGTSEEWISVGLGDLVSHD